ncbi:segregation and condensation protein B [Saccharopolyspora erythraea NRRL 2338]|nr:segregation and condensation protein B [Saccharopolyspora erythraea NRRL 2338]
MSERSGAEHEGTAPEAGPAGPAGPSPAEPGTAATESPTDAAVAAEPGRGEAERSAAAGSAEPDGAAERGDGGAGRPTAEADGARERADGGAASAEGAPAEGGAVSDAVEDLLAATHAPAETTSEPGANSAVAEDGPAESGSKSEAASAVVAEVLAAETSDTGAGDAAAEDGSAEEPGAEDGTAAVETNAAPDLSSDDDLDAALEALLLVVDVPAGEELLANTLDQPVARIREALRRLSDGYAEARRGIDLRRVGDGWRFYTRETYAPYVERYLLDGQRAKLTRAALETLAVIAYRQPVTRSRVAAVRGVNVDGVIRTLVGRGLIEEAGTDPETGGILYCTTELFLERLGLSSLKDLPPLAPLLPEVDAIDDV